MACTYTITLSYKPGLEFFDISKSLQYLNFLWTLISEVYLIALFEFHTAIKVCFSTLHFWMGKQVSLVDQVSQKWTATPKEGAATYYFAEFLLKTA